MISIFKYLNQLRNTDTPAALPLRFRRRDASGAMQAALLKAYRNLLAAAGESCAEAFPSLGAGLKKSLAAVADELRSGSWKPLSPEVVAATDGRAVSRLREWGRCVARISRQQAEELKSLLLMLTQSAEHVSRRDLASAQRIDAVAVRLKSISTVDDICQVRESLIESAADLKNAIQQHLAESSRQVAELRAQIASCESRLKSAEQRALIDPLTQLPNRICMENEIEMRIGSGARFSIAILDLDGFKAVNDQHGHVIGDQVLKQFADELRSACGAAELVGRWGGDEMILLLDTGLEKAQKQLDRIAAWVCGNYTVNDLNIRVDASIGVAEHQYHESVMQLIERADHAMYRRKSGLRMDAAS